ncbi:MAG: ORC1-type DNA replication protein [Euryarchaeota archaeon]|nr:ORC1-type DNA replication protein [Euryarchaeota archaeon]
MPAKELLQADQTLFRNPDLFDPEHLPEHVLHRESQMRGLQFCLKPAAEGRGKPVNALCIGTMATGKTTAVRTLFTQLEETTPNLVPVYIHCQVNATRYLVASHMYKKLYGHMPPHSGLSFEKVFSKVAKTLAESQRQMVVALDDIQYLFREKEIDAVLNSLLRAHETQPGASIGVVAIYSGEQFEYPLDPRVYSVFMPEEVRFDRYTRDQVHDILASRAREGFYPGVAGPEIIDRVADIAAATGDLRIGIDLLRRAALQAERQARRRIAPEDLETAHEKSRKVHLTMLLGGLRKEEKTLLKHICENEAKAGELQQKFEKETKLGYTTFHETLKRLEGLGLIHLEFTGKGTKGRSRIPKLHPRFPYQRQEILQVLQTQ